MYVLEELRPRPGSAAEQQAEHALVAPNSGAFSPHGKRVTGDATGLVLQGCDIVTPAKRCLARGLTFSVEAGTDGPTLAAANLAVVGPSGCGKTALCRVLAGLWPLPVGTVSLPKGKEGEPAALHVVSQQPLVPTAPISLRKCPCWPLCVVLLLDANPVDAGDLVTYPAVLSDADWTAVEPSIREDLQALRLEGLVAREGWDEPQPWHERLSYSATNLSVCLAFNSA